MLTNNPGFLFAFGAAFLFGASTPATKWLLPGTSPWLAAALLYLGSGIGLALLTLAGKLMAKPRPADHLRWKDAPWLAGATLFGGILGPVFLMWGLTHADAASASLLLNLEGVLTAALAWFAFKENFDRRIALGMALILAGGIVLSWSGGPTLENLTGPLLIAAACLCWALDNNFTRKVSGSNPVELVMVKSLVAGSTNLVLALAAGAALPSIHRTLLLATVGFAGYGLSLLCFVMSLRLIGTARTGAYFSIAPFAGALLSILFLGENLTLAIGSAAVLMGAGVWLHLTEDHGHEHEHEEIDHCHAHSHDEHHDHGHEDGASSESSHAHPHRHRKLRHTHAHFPDLHHQHTH